MYHHTGGTSERALDRLHIRGLIISERNTVAVEYTRRTRFNVASAVGRI